MTSYSLYVGAFFAAVLFGGSLFAMMLYASASSAPQSVLLLMHLRAPEMDLGHCFRFFRVDLGALLVNAGAF